MKTISFLLAVLILPFLNYGQVVPLSKVATLTLPEGYEAITPKSFPILPASNDLGSYSRK